MYCNTFMNLTLDDKKLYSILFSTNTSPIFTSILSPDMYEIINDLEKQKTLQHFKLYGKDGSFRRQDKK